MITNPSPAPPRTWLPRWALLAVALLVGLAWARPAQAQLDVCNSVRERLHIAVAYQTGSGWSSRGWHADPGECVTVIQGSLTGVSYYVSAHKDTGDGYEWEGDRLFCTADGTFTIVAVQHCSQRGYRSRQFIQVNVGLYTGYSFYLQYPSYGRQAVTDVLVSERLSTWEDGTRVLILQNSNPHAVSFNLKCYTVSGSSRILPISISRYGYSEVGFVQGWPGNFKRGERCEAYYEGNQIWYYDFR
jgi:uncharacterized membrane protein